MYSNRFVMTVLVDGKPLQERADGIISIPFGAEYTIRFKNKNNRRAVVRFTLDGENVSGNGYVINANDTVEIKRHHGVDRAFRFVELNSDEAILEGKGGANTDGSKGVIEAKFYLEKVVAQPQYRPVPVPYPVPYYHGPGWGNNPGGGLWGSGGDPWPELSNKSSNPNMRSYRSRRTRGAGGSSFDAAECEVSCSSNLEHSKSISPLSEGCTVEGTSTGQSFTTVSFNEESDYVTLRVVLRGHKATEQTVTTESEEMFCTKCGQKRSRKSDRFCGKCGGKF